MNKITIRQLTASTLLWLAACVIVGFASNVAHAQGTPNKLESIDVQNLVRSAGAAHAASLVAARRTGRVHHRQPRAHLARPREHRARAAVAPHRRALWRSRLDPRRRSRWPHAPRAQPRSPDALHDARLGQRRHHPHRRRQRLAGRRRRRFERCLRFARGAHRFGAAPSGPARHSRHRLPPRYRWHRPRHRAPLRSAHAGQPAPARQPDRRRLRRRRNRQQPRASL